MAIGDIITAARYNNLQSRVATVMGTGSGDDGYGQTLNSAQVAASATVNATDMSTLYTDIANGRVHQTGVTPTEIAIISQSDVVLDSDTINKKGVDMKGKFGRVLGDFLIDDKSVATIMCETGHAVAYYGGNKDELQAKHMANRQKLVAEGVVTGAVE